MSGSPMDPKRLAKLDELLDDDDRKRCPSNDDDWLRELRGEVKRLNAELKVARDFARSAVAEYQGQTDRALAMAETATANMTRATEVALDFKEEAQRYRSRCPVTAEDVEAVGVTRDQTMAWIRAQVPAAIFEHDWAEWSEHWLGMLEISPSDIAELCIEAHEEWGFGMSMDILDEMAKGAAR